MSKVLRFVAASVLTLTITVFFSAANPETLSAAPVTVLIGDDDGFGGTQGASSSPGDSYSNAAAAGLGVIAPGTYANLAALDVNTASPWATYMFSFDFAFDLSSLGSISSAIVEIQHGSLGRRITGISPGSGPGFGFAKVSASTGGPSSDLGDFFGVDTSPTGSALEESVKISSFDVASLLTAGTLGTLSLTIDGSAISSNPVDLFAMDFARLTVSGTSVVPLPAALPMLAGGLGLIGLLGWRRRHKALSA